MLEAMAVGLPSIGSNIPGIRDILRYEDLMFDPSDEEALAKRLRRLFSDFLHLQEIKGLCEDRKKAFIFDWKDAVFRAVTKRMSPRTVN